MLPYYDVRERMLTEEQINEIVDEDLKDEFVGRVEMIIGEYNII